MSASLEPFFRPESVAIVGASRHGGTIGYQILDNLLRHGYRGVVYPVNRTARAVHSIRAYATVLDIPGAVDLAVVVVPKDAVPEVVDQCGRKGVKALVAARWPRRSSGSRSSWVSTTPSSSSTSIPCWRSRRGPLLVDARIRVASGSHTDPPSG